MTVLAELTISTLKARGGEKCFVLVLEGNINTIEKDFGEQYAKDS